MRKHCAHFPHKLSGRSCISQSMIMAVSRCAKAQCHREYLVSGTLHVLSPPRFYRKPRCLLEGLKAAEPWRGAQAV